jgi:hypothetical protein
MTYLIVIQYLIDIYYFTRYIITSIITRIFTKKKSDALLLLN